MNCILYARVSTDRQAKQDLSIPAQIEAMRQYASNKKWQIAGEFIEEGKSGTTMKRPELNRLLEYCKKHKNVNSVIVHKLDRFARNLVDYTMIRSILKKSDIRLISVVENFEDSISGHLVENIMASIAEFYSANLGEETRKGSLSKLKQGGWPQMAPPGYINIVGEDGKKTVTIDEVKAPIIAEIFRLYALGNISLNDVSMEFFNRGVATRSNKSFTKDYAKRILTNKFYIGTMVWNGVEYPGKHEPIIDNAIFNKVQKVINERHKDTGEKGKLSFLLRGVAYCKSCEKKLTAERHARGNYYKCIYQSYPEKCTEPYIPVKLLDQQLMDIYKQLEPTDGLIELVRKRVKLKKEAIEKQQNQEIVPLERRKKHLDALLIKSAELLTQGAIEMPVYTNLKDKYNNEKAEIQTRLDNLRVDVSGIIDVFNKLARISRNIFQLNNKLKFPQKKKLLEAIFERIDVQNKEIISAKINPPFSILLKNGLNT